MPDTQPSHVTPSTELIICSGIPFESNYEHVILFTTSTMQYNYFYGKRKVILAPQGTPSAYYTYQRTNDGKIRIGCAIEQVINCNYLMFRNQAFENKWFYAFIQEINYINNNVTEIVYEIDVMQTWMFDYTLQECFVEREHSATDNVGDNTVPENLEVGEYVYKYLDTYNGNSQSSVPNYNKNDFSVVIYAPFEINATLVGSAYVVTTSKSESGYYNGNFTGLYFNVYYITDGVNDDSLKLWAVLKYLLDNKKDDIVAIYTMPSGIITQKQLIPVNTMLGEKVEIDKYSWVISGTSTCKNNKLYTYPYSFIYVYSSDGEGKEFKYELFNNGTNSEPYFDNTKCNFSVKGIMGAPPQLILQPLSYDEDVANSNVYSSFNNSMIIHNFPMSGWTTDAFKAWLAQSTTTLVGGIGALAVMPEVGGLLGVLPESMAAFTNMSYSASVYGAIANFPRAMLEGQKAHGSDKNLIAKSAGFFGFSIYQAHIKPEYAAIIDDYFNKYGYATKRVKVPNMYSRPYWNYVETKNCNINQGISSVGGLNNLDTRKISDVYDHGVTFWHAKYHAAGSTQVDVEVGNYDLDNSPIIM